MSKNEDILSAQCDSIELALEALAEFMPSVKVLFRRETCACFPCVCYGLYIEYNHTDKSGIVCNLRRIGELDGNGRLTAFRGEIK